jgi:hypothetical protein
MRWMFPATLCMMTLCSWLPGTARAQEYPWCVETLEGRTDCSFTTYAQCLKTASGVGGCCPNPRAVLNEKETGPPMRRREIAPYH